MRGKNEPNDIDILIIFKNKIDKDVEYELKNTLLKINNKISITSTTDLNIKKSTFPAREGYLFEGLSLLKNEPISKQFGFSSFGLFITSTKIMENKDRTRYYYALNGRGTSNGFLNETNSIRFSDDLFIIPLESIEKAKEFFGFWRIKTQYIPLLIPERLGVKGILGKVI